jgi:large subunit ribosomal protein L6
MLEQKQIKIPFNIKIFFLSVEKQQFLVFNNLQSKVLLSIKIPTLISVMKQKNMLLIQKQTLLTREDKITSFHTYLKNFIINFQIPTKKTLILRGLGLKINMEADSLNLKLGYSHESVVDIIPTNTSTVILGKKFISIINYNKLFLGNFAEKIYRLKKANCYKGRGLYYKEKRIISKAVKKT